MRSPVRDERKEIQANASPANDDSLRCWRFRPVFAWLSEEQCVENVVAGQEIAIASSIDADVFGGSRCGEKLRVELDDKTSRCVLKSGEGVGVGEGGLKVCQHLGHGSVPGRTGRLGRWTAASQQGGADAALAEEESSPESLPGSGAEPAANVACGVSDAVGDDALQEPPQ